MTAIKVDSPTPQLLLAAASPGTERWVTIDVRNAPGVIKYDSGGDTLTREAGVLLSPGRMRGLEGAPASADIYGVNARPGYPCTFIIQTGAL